MKKETNLFKIEACIGTLQSGLEAEKGGANRVELCDNLAEGGTTPSAALIQMTKEKLQIPAAVMIRPRHGDFLYSDLEFEIMKRDIYFCKSIGVEAVVFGLLTNDGRIDCERTKKLVQEAGNMEVCFHRAVDLSRDYFEAIEQIINCGCKRILTSGAANKAVEGFENIKKAVKNPLKRKIGAYYGCLLLRPSGVMAFDNPENPTIIEDFIKAIGGTPVVYPFRNECCGAYVALKNSELPKQKSQKVLSSAKEKGAEEVITACPLCLYNLKENGGGSIEVKYFTELLAEALGVK